jgi:hypothetical protein
MQNEQHESNLTPIRLAAGGPPAQHREMLAELSCRLDRPHSFAKGQFVRWKPGLRNRSLPDYGEPAIVRAVLPCPVVNPEENPSSPYYREPMTMIIGGFMEDDLVEFHVDTRRFEPFED